MSLDFMSELMGDPSIAEYVRRRGLLNGDAPPPPAPGGGIASADDAGGYGQDTADAPGTAPSAGPPPPMADDIQEGGSYAPSEGPNPTQTFSNPRPSLRQRIGQTIGRLATAGIAAAATPNVAYGGPTDIFRAMQAGRGAVQNQDIMAYQMARQRQLDEEQRRYREMQMAELEGRMQREEAQARRQDALAGAPPKLTPEAELYQAWQNAPAGPDKDAAWNNLLAYRGHAPKATGPKVTAKGVYNPDTEEFTPFETSGTADGRLAEARKILGLPDGTPFEKLPEDWQAYVIHGTRNQPTEKPTLHNVSPGGYVVDESGKTIFHAPDKPTREVDPLVEERRRQMIEEQNSKVSDNIDKAKQTGLERADKQEQVDMQNLLKSDPLLAATIQANEMAQANGQPPRPLTPQQQAKIQKVKDDARRRRQEVYDSYSNAIRRHGGTAEDWVVGADGSVTPKGPAYAAGHPATGAPQQAAGGHPAAGGAQKPKYTEQQVRDRARAAGKNEDAAVQAARAAHLI